MRAAIGAAVARERLASTEGRYPLLLPPGTGPRRARRGPAGPHAPEPAARAATDIDMELLDELRAWRRAEAATRGVPAYVVANDRALADIATRRPTDAAGLLECSGVGRTFIERYGEAVLQMIAARRTAPQPAEKLAAAPPVRFQTTGSAAPVHDVAL